MVSLNKALLGPYFLGGGGLQGKGVPWVPMIFLGGGDGKERWNGWGLLVMNICHWLLKVTYWILMVIQSQGGQDLILLMAEILHHLGW